MSIDKNTPLTFKSTGNVQLKINKDNLFYNKNNIGWEKYTAEVYLNLIDGDQVAFSGTNDVIDECFEIVGDGTIELFGNATSLTNYSLNKKGLSRLFFNCKQIVDASELILPNTTLEERCYMNMFNSCSNLTAAPALPATGLADWCYMQMFCDCRALTTVPQLPATELASECYQSMFYNCISLSSVSPNYLPATTLAPKCYFQMFCNTGLTAIPNLPATDLALSCYSHMFINCPHLTTKPILSATTLKDWCYYSMFKYCTSLTEAPDLPAPELVPHCYDNMFCNCIALSSINVSFRSWLNDENATERWMDGVALSGVFTKPNKLLDSNIPNRIPQNWTVVNKQ